MALEELHVLIDEETAARVQDQIQEFNQQHRAD